MTSINGSQEMSFSNEHWQQLQEASIIINEESEQDGNDHKGDHKHRLSAEFGAPFTIFISLLIIMTMGMLMYGNTTVGAYVSVQVTPQLPFTSDVDQLGSLSPEMGDNVTAWPPSPDNLSLRSI